jgi:hypothetical protein
MNKATGANRGDQRRGSARSRADHGAGAEMISERSRSQREHNCRPDGSANLLPRCANSARDQKLRLRKFACLAAIATMLVLSGRAAELAQIYGVSAEEEQAKLTLSDYFDIHLDHAPKEGAELVLDPIVLVARSISGGRVSVVGLRLPEDEEAAVPLTRWQAFRRKLSDIWSSVAWVCAHGCIALPIFIKRLRR